MKKSALSLLAFLLLIITGCKNNDSEILSTIPVNTSAFAVVDMKKVMTNLGNEVKKDGGIEPGEAFRQIIKRFQPNSSGSDAIFLEGISSVDFSRDLGVFEYKSQPIVTFYVTNAKDFRKVVEKDLGAMSENGGVWSNSRGFFMADDQVWISGGASTFTVETVNMLRNMPEKESLASEEYAVGMVESDDDVVGYVNIPRLQSLSGGMGNNMMATALMGVCFDDAKYAAFKVDFDKGEAKAEVKVLDSKFKPANYILKTQPIDVATVKAYPGKGFSFIAFSISPEQIRELSDRFGMIAGSYKNLLDLLTNLEGTVVGSVGNNQFGLMARFTAEDKAAAVADYLKGMTGDSGIMIEQNGTGLYVHTPVLDGVAIGGYADEMSGAESAFVTDMAQAVPGQNLVTQAVMKTKKDKDSIVLNFNITTKPGQNSLLSMLELIAQQAER